MKTTWTWKSECSKSACSPENDRRCRRLWEWGHDLKWGRSTPALRSGCPCAWPQLWTEQMPVGIKWNSPKSQNDGKCHPRSASLASRSEFLQLKVVMIITDPDKPDWPMRSAVWNSYRALTSHTAVERASTWENQKARCCGQQIFDGISGLCFTTAILTTTQNSVFSKAYLHPRLADSSLTTGQCLNLETQRQEQQAIQSH